MPHSASRDTSLKRAFCRFYAELNDFLPPEERCRPIERAVGAPGAVKDFIGALGVPHTEVDLILINGESAGFMQRVREGDRVSVYPAGGEGGGGRSPAAANA